MQIENRRKITAKTAQFRKKIAKKGRRRTLSLNRFIYLFIFYIFDKSTRVFLTPSGHMFQQTQGLFYDLLCVFLPVLWCT